MACHLLSQALERQPQFQVIDTVVENEGLLPALERSTPDIVLIGVHLQDGPFTGFTRLQQMRAQFPDLAFIMLLDRTEPQLVRDAFRAGARGVFARSESDVKLLCKCIQRVAEGQIWADNRQLECVMEAFSNEPLNTEQPHSKPLSLLTAREEVVVRLVAEGMGNREIARELKLSEHTIKNYLFRIFEKLGFSNRVELVLYAIARLNQKPTEFQQSATGTS
jgi:DNA-binding NarL/FixJ family response regulator